MGPAGLVIDTFTLSLAKDFEIWSNFNMQSEPLGSSKGGTLIVMTSFREIFNYA